jgi:hypothetical protein
MPNDMPINDLNLNRAIADFLSPFQAGLHLHNTPKFKEECEDIYKNGLIIEKQCTKEKFVVICSELLQRRLLANMFEFNYTSCFAGNKFATQGLNARMARDLCAEHVTLDQLSIKSAKEFLDNNKGQHPQLSTPCAVNLSLQQHGIALYYFKPNQTEKAYIFIGNRGAGADASKGFGPGIHIYEINKNESDRRFKNLVESSLFGHASPEEYYSDVSRCFLYAEHTKHYYQLPEQFSGSCAWNAVEMLMQIHLAVNASKNTTKINWQESFDKTKPQYLEIVNGLKTQFLQNYLKKFENKENAELIDKNFFASILLQAEYNPYYSWLKENTSCMGKVYKLAEISKLYLQDAIKIINEHEFYSSPAFNNIENKRVFKILKIGIAAGIFGGALAAALLMARKPQEKSSLIYDARDIGLLLFSSANLVGHFVIPAPKIKQEESRRSASI